MARVNVVGFETGNTTELTSVSANVSVQSTTKRTGTYAMQCNPTAGRASAQLLAFAATGAQTTNFNTTSLYVRWYFRFASLPAANVEVLAIQDTAGVFQVLLEVTSTGTLVLKYTNGSGVLTQIGSASSALSSGTWYRIEVAGVNVATAASSTVEAKLDGTAFATGSSLTVGSTQRNTGIVEVGNSRSDDTYNVYYDDIAIDNAAYPGIGEVHILKPNATGTTSAWTNGAGTSPTNVAEVPHDSDTGYIKSSTSGNVTTVNLDSSATGGVSGTIAATKVIGIVRDVGGVSSMSIRAKSSATNSDTTAVDPGASYVALSKILTTDPNTSAAWTTSGLDALEIGVVNSASVAVRCTALYAMVECDGAVAATGYTNLPLLGVG